MRLAVNTSGQTATVSKLYHVIFMYCCSYFHSEVDGGDDGEEEDKLEKRWKFSYPRCRDSSRDFFFHDPLTRFCCRWLPLGVGLSFATVVVTEIPLSLAIFRTAAAVNTSIRLSWSSSQSPGISSCKATLCTVCSNKWASISPPVQYTR